jgi:predicted Rossmann-fold nucleotide-binding protein
MGSAFGGRSADSDRRVRRSVCVFCSFAGGLPEGYRQAARDLGAELAGRGHRLVYGGGNVGLMGEVARSVHAHGGTVIGVIPQGLVDRELAYDPADELLVTETLRDHNDTFPVRTSAQAPQAVGPRSSAVGVHPVAGDPGAHCTSSV